jgi:hypothetical protein
VLTVESGTEICQERVRLYNATARQKEAKRASKRRRNELRANTLRSDSIVMENPMYIYETASP